jgi:hypothetical protein
MSLNKILIAINFDKTINGQYEHHFQYFSNEISVAFDLYLEEDMFKKFKNVFKAIKKNIYYRLTITKKNNFNILICSTGDGTVTFMFRNNNEQCEDSFGFELKNELCTEAFKEYIDKIRAKK